LRYLGERSYAIYLWHWPVCLLTRPGIDIPLTGAANAAARLAITLVLAEISYQLVERPIRAHGFLAVLRTPRPAVPRAGVEAPATTLPSAVGRHSVPTAVAFAGPGVRFAPATLRSSAAPQAASTPRRPLIPVLRIAVLTIVFVSGAIWTGISLTVASRPAAASIDLPTSSQSQPTATVPPHPRVPLGAKVEFFGDSQVTSLLKPENRPPNLGVYIDAVDAAIPGCGILPGKIEFGGAQRDVACPQWHDIWKQRVDQQEPALAVIVIGGWETYDLLTESGAPLPFGSDAWDANLSATIAQAITILWAPDRPVALALLPCYRLGTNAIQDSSDRDARTEHVNDLLRAAAASFPTGVYTIQPPDDFCKEPIASDRGYRPDGMHYTPKGAALYFQAMLPQILDMSAGADTSTASPATP
jgi:hypothetical protein